MLSVEEALAVVLRHVPRLGTEDVALDQSLGRVLGEDAASDVDLPPFDRAAMDGFALRAADAAQPGAVLRVTGQVRAGQFPERGPAPGEAFEIMTGAPLPPAADAVVQVEKTRRLDGARVELHAAAEAGLNVARRGGEVRAGEVVLHAGIAIDPAAIAVLASVGAARVRVGQRPRVAVLATGDELVDVAERPGPGRIRDSNGPALAAQARLAGAAVRVLERAPDEAEALTAALRAGLDADLLAISGGVSEGAYDLVEPALERLGVRKLFERVALKPGAPLVFGVRGTTLVFGLPGNPVSSQVTFELFARPALLAMQGARTLARPRVEVELLAALRNKSGRRAHLPARVRFEHGRLCAWPLRSTGSADVRAHAEANALVVLEAERTHAAAGERAPALLLGNFLERAGRAPEEPA
jgi:molybdopterin molybdotransferase